MTKRITIKKIMLMLYALLMCLPLISVGFRSLYVTFNENAYESYYGETINESETLIANNHYVIGQEYTLTIGNKAYTEQNEVILNVSNVSSEQMTGINIENTNNIHIRSQNGNTYALFYNGTNYITDRNFLITNPNTVKFTYLGSNNVNLNSNYVDTITYIEYNNYSYLDNAFDYSLHEFIDNNNTGLINFVGLFSDMFLGNSNVENGLYLGFANFMMNYALFISCAYFVFEVLMWFINYCRKWIYAFEEKGGAE